MPLNQKGIGHLLLIVLVLVGIVCGIFLIKNPTFFKPKAYEVDTNSSLSASPNPCQLQSGSNTCTSTISWDICSTSGQSTIKITIKESPGSLFALGCRGSQAAPWISSSGATFELYKDQTLISSLNVKAGNQIEKDVAIAPPCIPIPSGMPLLPNINPDNTNGRPIDTDRNLDNRLPQPSCLPFPSLPPLPSGMTLPSLPPVIIPTPSPKACTKTCTGGQTCIDGVCANTSSGVPCVSSFSQRTGERSDSCPSGYACDNSSGTGCTDDHPSSFCTSSGFCQPASKPPLPSTIACSQNNDNCPTGYHCDSPCWHGEAHCDTLSGFCTPN